MPHVSRELFHSMYPYFERHVAKGMTYRDIMRHANRYRNLFFRTNSKRHTKKYYVKWTYWVGIAIIAQRFVEYDDHGSQGELSSRNGQGAGLPGS